MSNTDGKWAREQFPLAEVVYDHFHVIKLVNDAIDDLRQRTRYDLNMGVPKPWVMCEIL